MTIELKIPDVKELKPRIMVFGVGGGGGNAVNNMVQAGLAGVDFVVANTDAQALTMSKAERVIQMGLNVTQGLGAGSHPEVGAAAAQEAIDEISDHLSGAHMAFITAGMGGGTGTGAAPVIAKVARDQGILTVGVITKPFHFEGKPRMTTAEKGIEELHKFVDTLIVIPNQNLFRIANEKTTFAEACAMADDVLYSGVACITDLMVKEGLINLDFADVRSVMREMGKAMMGTGEASGEKRAIQAAEAAIANPLLDDTSMRGAGGLLISITGGPDLTLFEVDEAASRIREEVDENTNIILGATFDDALEGSVRISVVATGIDHEAQSVVQGGEVGETLSAPKPDRIAAYGPSRKARENTPAAPEAAKTSRTFAGEGLQGAAQQRRQEGDQIQARLNDITSRLASAATGSQSAAEAASLGKDTQSSPSPSPSASAQTQAQTPAVTALQDADPDISIEPVSRSPRIIDEPVIADTEPAEPTLEEELARHQEPFIPPVAMTPRASKPRVPELDAFPPIVRDAVKASTQSREAREAASERTPMSLLKRLAHVGLGRRDEPHPDLEIKKSDSKEQAPPVHGDAKPASQPEAPLESASRQPTETIEPTHRERPKSLQVSQKPQIHVRGGDNLHARQPAADDQAQSPVSDQPIATSRRAPGTPTTRIVEGKLDERGREPAPQPTNPIEDADLDIPAFLKRQSN